MNEEQAKQLRAPFPPTSIGKLPKPTRKENPKGHCDECGGYHGLPAIHLDYVGHAATTDRLLQIDPEWTWRPMALGPNGEPLITNSGLWIELTICGVTRPGFGDGASPKEIIGDAIRNAAMRFGVALDLWAKEDLHSQNGDPPAEPTFSEPGVYEPGIAEDPGAASTVEAAAVETDKGEAAAAPGNSIATSTRDKPLTKAQQTKLGVLVRELRDEKGLLSTAQLWAGMARNRGIDMETQIGLVADAYDSEDVLHFGPLMQTLTRGEASQLIDQLSDFAARQ